MKTVYILMLYLTYEVSADTILGVYATERAANDARDDYARKDSYLKGAWKRDGVALEVEPHEVKEA